MTQDDFLLVSIREALDGLAYAAFEAGHDGMAFLSDAEDVTAWIELVMKKVQDIKDAG